MILHSILTLAKASWQLTGLCCIVGCLAAAAASNEPTVRPNVLLIVCDDLNAHVTPSGYQPIHTPNFARLASHGVTFRRAYCQYPVCNGSRTSFLHGLYPQTTGVTSNKVDIRDIHPGTVSIPQHFKAHGYWTAAVGKVFHNPDIDPGKIAWHENLRFENDELPLVAEARKEFEARHGPIDRGPNRRRWREFLSGYSKQTRGQQRPGYGPSGLRDEQHRDGKNVRQVAKWLREAAFHNQPFFIACGIHKPHVPFLAPDKYFELYPPSSLKYVLDPPDFWEQMPKTAMSKRYAGFGFELGVENEPLRREYMQAYHACISFVDAQIGILFDTLKATGHWDDTIVILTSDHGYQLGEHFMWGKVTLFEVCDEVPLIVRVPGLTPSGQAADEIVELVDLFPTLNELCALPDVPGLQGESFAPLLRSPRSAKGKEYAYTVVARGPQLGKSVRTKRWRYGVWPDGEELFDIQHDPHEWRNLAGSERHREVLATMRALLQAADEKASRHSR